MASLRRRSHSGRDGAMLTTQLGGSGTLVGERTAGTSSTQYATAPATPTLQPTPVYDALKRLLDFTVALTLLVLLLPVMIAVAVAIKLDSPGPVLFRQNRLGRQTRAFPMLKFRTMFVNSDSIPRDLALKNESTGPLFKMKHDPRITRFGRFLRRTSLDELPQLFNVLAGHMSLVGPRPPLPRELAGYDSVQRLRLRVLPGLTGLWQVSGRSNLPFDEMVRLDLRYIDERSFWLDLIILAKTLPSVITCRGAF